MKLSPPKSAVLLAASARKFIHFSDVLRVGGNAATLAALVRKGLLVKNSYPDGSKD